MKSEKLSEFIHELNLHLYKEITNNYQKINNLKVGLIQELHSFFENVISCNLPLNGLCIIKDGRCFEVSSLMIDEDVIFVQGKLTQCVGTIYNLTFSLKDFSESELMFFADLLAKRMIEHKVKNGFYDLTPNKEYYIWYFLNLLGEDDLLDVADAAVFYNDDLITHIVKTRNTINFYRGDPSTEDYAIKLHIDKDSKEFLEICEKLVSKI